jgi:formate hydrogenlyase subunit 3/multisubunit Na+/H+ antiporter MnhD subunit
LLIVAGLYWRRRSSTPQLLALLASGGCLALFGFRSAYLELESSRLDKGLPWLAGGLTVLGLALLVSFMKAGFLARGWLLMRSINKN